MRALWLEIVKLTRVFYVVLYSFGLIPASAFGAGIPYVDDSAEVIASMDMTGSQYAWRLRYGQARRLTFRALAEGRDQEALQAARMQFILSPHNDPEYVEIAVALAKTALLQVGQDSALADSFEQYAINGPAGPDGQVGTGDDLSDPFADIGLDIFGRDARYYEQFDKTIRDRQKMAPEWAVEWYEVERAYARLDGAEFEDAGRILTEVLTRVVQSKYDGVYSNAGEWALRQREYTIQLARIGLGIVYKARNGTVSGLEVFLEQCEDYARFGPAGSDARIGTEDDLSLPAW